MEDGKAPLLVIEAATEDPLFPPGAQAPDLKLLEVPLPHAST